MTQFSPPPYAPPPLPYGAVIVTRPPWSISAISAFVCSLLGCLGVPAVLGFVLGIVGVVRSSGGKRRGMGLAIAAIPISLVTGVISLGILAVVLFTVSYAPMLKKLDEGLKASSTDVERVAAALHAFGSADFQNAVTLAQLNQWLDQVREKHGNLVELTDVKGTRTNVIPQSTPRGMRIPLPLEGKFVNGIALVRVTLLWEGFAKVSIDDLEIDGVSPRGREQAGPTP